MWCLYNGDWGDFEIGLYRRINVLSYSYRIENFIHYTKMLVAYVKQ